MRISIAVMAHPSRRKQAVALAKKLKTMPFTSWRVVFDTGNGEWPTGERAIRGHDDSDWHIILQDDAIISETFYDNVVAALSAVPSKSLVSFYLGTVRPIPRTVKRVYNRAIGRDASWISYQTLLWGVGIAIPTEQIHAVLVNAKGSKELYDRRIGSYYNRNKMPVYYTTISLVDHNDSLGSILGHGGTKEPRVAQDFVGDRFLSFNSKVQPI